MKSLPYLIILALILIGGFLVLNEKKEYKDLERKYTALYEAKTKSDTVIIIDTLRIKELEPGKQVTDSVIVTDTLYLNQPLQDRTYVNTLYKGDVRVDYKALTRGWLMDLEVDVIVPTTEIHTQSIVTELQPYRLPDYKLSAGVGIVIPQGYYATVGYRPGRLTYKFTYLSIQKENMFAAGVEINF